MMTTFAQNREQLMRAAVLRGKYAALFHHLSGLVLDEWTTTFREIEKILGFVLPNSARVYRPWWANGADAHSQSMAWTLAGWRTSSVNLNSETLTFLRTSSSSEGEAMPQGLSTSRTKAPSMEDFRNALAAIFNVAQDDGKSHVRVRAGDLHRQVGGYPTPFNRMQMCCNAMYQEQAAMDYLVAKPTKGFGASLTIEFRLPRSKLGLIDGVTSR